MENPTDGQDVSQRDLAPVSEEELLSLLVDPETDDFHSWLFDILMHFEFEEDETLCNPCEDLTDSELEDDEAQDEPRDKLLDSELKDDETQGDPQEDLTDSEVDGDETQGDPREKLLETLVNRCHDAEGMSTEARDFRKKVLKVVLQEAVYKPQAALSGQDADMETPIPISEVLQEFMDELSKRRSKERMKRIKDIAEKKEIKSRLWLRALEEDEKEQQDEAKVKMEWQLSIIGSRNHIAEDASVARGSKGNVPTSPETSRPLDDASKNARIPDA